MDDSGYFSQREWRGVCRYDIMNATTSGSDVRVALNSGGFFNAIHRQTRVVGALIIRDMKTRFGANSLAFTVTIGWSVVHAGIILLTYILVSRPASYGTSIVAWTLSGAIPFVVFLYTLRWVGTSISSNLSLLSFPVVKSIDIIIARGILEIVTATVTTILLFVIALILDRDFSIANYLTVIEAIGAAYFLGFSLGVLFAPLVIAYQALYIAMALLPILVWVTSGVIFMPDSLPDPYRGYVAINPLLHAMEWFRMGLYSNYRSATLDKAYLIDLSLVFLLVGLVITRIRHP